LRLAVALLAVVSTLFGCSNRPPADHFIAVLDRLHVPAAWTLAYAAVRAPGSTFIACEFVVNSDCPSAHRFYLVNGDPAPAYGDAKAMLIEAGFLIADEFNPDCIDSHDPVLACELTATSGSDGLVVLFSDPGVDREELGIADPTSSIVELRAYPLPERRDP